MPDVVVLGSLNMDLVVTTDEMPQPGETVRGHHFVTIPGGKGANQAAAAARLGAQVQMIGRVGGDSFGSVLLDNMRAQGVGVSHVIVDKEVASGTAMIIIDARGENSIVVAPGANGRVSMDDVRAAHVLLNRARYLVMQFEIPLPVVRATIGLANQLGVLVILNAAPAYPVDAAFLRGVYTLVVNESEARALTGVTVGDVSTAKRTAQALVDLGMPVVIVTLGAKGALLATRGGLVHVPARRVRVVDTTAAGDAFVGAFTTALLRGFDLPEAVRYATCAGTLATTVLGAQTSLPSAAQVETFYEGAQP